MAWVIPINPNPTTAMLFFITSQFKNSLLKILQNKTQNKEVHSDISFQNGIFNIPKNGLI